METGERPLHPKFLILLGCAVTIAVLDRASKWVIEATVAPERPIVVIEGFFQITHARNPGAALGLFQDLPWWVFVGLTLVALWLIALFYRGIEPDQRLPAAALGLIVGGALGNLWDRVLPPHSVIDFLHFDLGLFVFPDFNLADSAIVIGVGLLLLDSATGEAEQSASASSGETARDSPESAH